MKTYYLTSIHIKSLISLNLNLYGDDMLDFGKDLANLLSTSNKFTETKLTFKEDKEIAFLNKENMDEANQTKC